jgi:hypothetical protein
MNVMHSNRLGQLPPILQFGIEVKMNAIKAVQQFALLIPEFEDCRWLS